MDILRPKAKREGHTSGSGDNEPGSKKAKHAAAASNRQLTLLDEDLDRTASERFEGGIPRMNMEDQVLEHGASLCERLKNREAQVVKLQAEVRAKDQLISKLQAEMEARCSENSKSLEVLMEEKDNLLQAYNATKSTREGFQRILNGHEKLKSHLESYKNDLELRELELEKREALNENERKMLAEELEQIALQNSTALQLAALEQRADENLIKLAEEQKRQKEELYLRILKLEKQLDEKQALELEIERLRGCLNVMRHMADDCGIEFQTKMMGTLKELREKQEELDNLKLLNQCLLVKEHTSSHELQEARDELIEGYREIL